MPHVLQHTSGQVEIDAIFIGHRAGKAHLLVLAAKSDTKYHTLAKHKLVYPLLALAKAPLVKSLPLVLVHLKMDARKDGADYHITECRLPDPRQRIPALDQLEPVAHHFLPLTF